MIYYLSNGMNSCMHRRKLLKSIGAGGLLTLGVGTATARQPNGLESSDLDTVHIQRGGEIVATLENPSVSNVRRLHAELGSAEELVTPEKCCLVECKDDCLNCDADCCDYMYDC